MTSAKFEQCLRHVSGHGSPRAQPSPVARSTQTRSLKHPAKGCIARKTAGFLAFTGSRSAVSRPAPETRSEITARLTPGSASFWNQGSSPSHPFCVSRDDLASVSPIVRPISRSVRWSSPSVSANVRRKQPLIARQPHFDCAPLYITTNLATNAWAIHGWSATRTTMETKTQVLIAYWC